MIKPVFTEGEWKRLEDQVYSDPKGMIANCDVGQEISQSRANAQLMVASKDMLEELINSTKQMENILNEYPAVMSDTDKSVIQFQINDNKRALQKAGVVL